MLLPHSSGGQKPETDVSFLLQLLEASCIPWLWPLLHLQRQHMPSQISLRLWPLTVLPPSCLYKDPCDCIRHTQIIQGNLPISQPFINQSCKSVLLCQVTYSQIRMRTSVGGYYSITPSVTAVSI